MCNQGERIVTLSNYPREFRDSRFQESGHFIDSRFRIEESDGYIWFSNLIQLPEANDRSISDLDLSGITFEKVFKKIMDNDLTAF